MFCVECGAEGSTYEGLCARDFLKKHPVVAPPDVLDLDRCTSCGSFRLASGWAKMDRGPAMAGLLRENLRKLPPWERVTFTHVARDEDANNLSLTVKALGRFEALQSVQDFRVRVRIKPTLCDSCQKQRSRYFEGVLQGRGDGRELTPQEIRGVRTFVLARVDRTGETGAFISRIETVHGALDFVMASTAAKSSRSSRSRRKRGRCARAPRIGPRERSSSGPRRARTCPRCRRGLRRLKGRRDFVDANEGGPGLSGPGRPPGRGSRGRMHHAPARGGRERQDEFLLAARTERRAGGTQGDLHRHGGRVAPSAPADLR